MGGVRDLFSATRLSRRRGMKLRSPRTGDMLLYSWLVVVIFIRFTQNCALAVRELTHGSRPVGLVLTEFSLLHFLLVAFLLTFLSATLSLGATSLNKKRLALAAVPSWQLMNAELASLAVNPMTWVVFAFAIPAAIPLLAYSPPTTAVPTLVAGFAAAILSASALGQSLTLSRTAHRLAGMFRFLFVAAMLGLVAANFDFQWTDRSVRLFVFQRPTLLDDGAGRGLLPRLRPWSPSEWIFGGWVLPCLALLAASILIYAVALRAVYRASGKTAPFKTLRVAKGSQGKHSTLLNAQWGTRALLFRQELRHLASSPGNIAGLAAAAGSSAWLLAAREPVVGIAILGSFGVLLTGFSYPSNVFGYDGRALRRYALLSPDWAEIFAAKNFAWLLLTGVSLAPLVVSAVLRTSALAALSFVLSSGVVMMLCTLWGNMSSILFPSERPRGGATPPQNAAFANQVAPFAICAIPLAIHRTVAPFGSLYFDLALAGCIAAGLALYVALLRRISRTFDGELENIMQRF